MRPPRHHGSDRHLLDGWADEVRHSVVADVDPLVAAETAQRAAAAVSTAASLTVAAGAVTGGTTVTATTAVGTLTAKLVAASVITAAVAGGVVATGTLPAIPGAGDATLTDTTVQASVAAEVARLQAGAAGSIDVRLEGRLVTVAGIDPAAGWTARLVESAAGEVAVEFRSDAELVTVTAAAGDDGGIDSAVDSRLLADPVPVAQLAPVGPPDEVEIESGASLDGSVGLEAPATEVTVGGGAMLDLGLGG